MKLPNRGQAFIPPAKIFDYLLSATHRVGKSKARFFTLLGFDLDSASALVEELLALAQSGEVDEEIPTQFGQKYVLDGTIATPNGKRVTICTVWIIENGQDTPRFVTAHPLSK